MTTGIVDTTSAGEEKGSVLASDVFVHECTNALNLPVRVEVLGVSVDPWTMGQTVQAADWFIQNGRFAHLIGVNADKLLQMRDDQRMDGIVRRCEIVNADGASMVMAARLLGRTVPERVAGIDLMGELCRLAQKNGYPVFLLGAKQEIVDKTAGALEQTYPEIKIAGVRNGYYAKEEVDDVVEYVEKVDPKIVFVGITSPKKEMLIERFREQGSNRVFVGVGGSFDVLSGSIPRAPLWMQKTNLEWLFRMVQEPKRLGWRYISGNIRFLYILQAEMRRKGSA